MLGIFLGLMSALVWGTGDFVGGLASRRSSAYQVVLLAEWIGLLVLALIASFLQEPFFGWTAWLWCASGGAIGSLGLVLLYRALTKGKMSLAVPVSALMAALLPAVTGSFFEGLPGGLTFAGFGLALAAIWLVSKPETGNEPALTHSTDLLLPMLAGMCFGLYFILVHQGNQGNAIWPMLASRSGGAIALSLLLVPFRKQDWKPAMATLPLIALNAMLDIGGNTFYILSDQVGRMDIAAVLSSLYPAATVGLAWLLLRERIAAHQWVGVLLALAALALIAL